MKAVVAAFNQEKALVGAFSVIVQLHRLIDLRHYPALSGLYHCTWDSRGYLSCFSEQEECGVHLLKGKLVFLAGEDSEGDKMGAVLEIAGARCDTVTHCPRDTHCLLERLGIFCKT